MGSKKKRARDGRQQKNLKIVLHLLNNYKTRSKNCKKRSKSPFKKKGAQKKKKKKWAPDGRMKKAPIKKKWACSKKKKKWALDGRQPKKLKIVLHLLKNFKKSTKKVQKKVKTALQKKWAHQKTKGGKMGAKKNAHFFKGVLEKKKGFPHF